jgi:hypothetical protein
LPFVAHNCEFDPLQIESGPVMFITKEGLIVSECEDELVHPLTPVTVTVYNPELEAVIQLFVLPVFHRYNESPAGAQS